MQHQPQQQPADGPLAAAIAAADPHDAGAVEALRQLFLSTLPSDGADAADAPAAEALLSCIMESFVSAGERGRALLDQLLLDVLPPLAALAPVSEGAAQAAASFCSLAAAACAPRDTITAFLEVMDQQMADSRLGPASLNFLLVLLGLLPQQLSKLSRCKAAFAVECLVPAAALAKVHGELLGSWTMMQLQQAAGAQAATGGGGTGTGSSSADAPAAVWRRVSTFLAANWQLYAEFARDVLLKVLPSEPDVAARQSAQLAVGQLVLDLLLHLTAAWQPLQLRGVALQLLTPGAAGTQLPSAESVAAPVPLLTLQHRSQQQAQQPAAAGQPVDSDSLGAGDAEDVLTGLLGLLRESGAAGWGDLASCSGDEAAGAGLAVVHSSWLEQQQQQQPSLQLPPSPDTALQLACRWSGALFDASAGNPLVILKAIALLQVAAKHVTAAHTREADTAPPAAAGSNDGNDSLFQAAAMLLLPDLRPCVDALASTIAQAAAVPLRAQATLALQQVLRALQPRVRYCCLQQLLSGAGRVHSEVATLLMQEVRQQLAQPGASDGVFSCSSCADLVLPWLQQSGDVGWKSHAVLADQANAVCAALAVVRLALLRSQHNTAGAHNGAGNGAVRSKLQACLPALAAAVSAALRELQEDEEAVDDNTVQQQQQQQQRIAGEATGAGQAVDAWLAVSRVQDVLERVLELL